MLLGLLVTSALASPLKRAECNPGRQTINGEELTVSCGVNRPLGDYHNLQGRFDTCAADCRADDNCATAVYHEDNGFCYYKNVVNDLELQADSVVVDKGMACKQSTTLTLNGLQCTISCGTDRHGGDYGNQRTGNYLACASACAADSNCVTAQYNEGNGYCYFKNVANTAVSSTDTDTIDCIQSSD